MNQFARASLLLFLLLIDYRYVLIYVLIGDMCDTEAVVYKLKFFFPFLFVAFALFLCFCFSCFVVYDVFLIFSCPADHPPDWQPRTRLFLIIGIVEAQ